MIPKPLLRMMLALVIASLTAHLLGRLDRTRLRPASRKASPITAERQLVIKTGGAKAVIALRRQRRASSTHLDHGGFVTVIGSGLDRAPHRGARGPGRAGDAGAPRERPPDDHRPGNGMERRADRLRVRQRSGLRGPASPTVKGATDMPLFTRRTEEVPCTVEVSHRFESLHAHVRFDNGAVVYPGDEVLVHGRPIMAAYGEVIVENRTATITRATPPRTALDPHDRRLRVHGALRIFLLGRGDAMNATPDGPTPTRGRNPARSGRPTPPRWRPRRRC